MLEWHLADEKVCVFLIAADFVECNSARAISVRLLDPSSSRGIYSSSLCGKLFSGSFSTSWLLHLSHLLVIMTCSILAFCVVRLAGFMVCNCAGHQEKQDVVPHLWWHMSKFQPTALNYSTLHNTYTLHLALHKHKVSIVLLPRHCILLVSKDSRSYEPNYWGREQRN
jgi:hypothetical protein